MRAQVLICISFLYFVTLTMCYLVTSQSGYWESFYHWNPQHSQHTTTSLVSKPHLFGNLEYLNVANARVYKKWVKMMNHCYYLQFIAIIYTHTLADDIIIYNTLSWKLK